MKALRDNLALAIDGGGIKGVMIAQALARLEEELGQPLHERVRLAVGTSTGAIIAAGIALGMDAATITQMYRDLGEQVFRKSWRNLPIIEYLVNYRYGNKPLMRVFEGQAQGKTVRELHKERPDFHMVVTATDILANTTRFIKLYEEHYADWRLSDVVMASSTIPTVFPVFKHAYRREPDEVPEERYWVDGGVGSYNNPCYVAAYEIAYHLDSRGWTPENTTLISIGSGKSPQDQVWDRRLRLRLFPFIKRKPEDMLVPEWALPAIDSFFHQAARQQVRLVRKFFSTLDFRRFSIDFDELIMPDQAECIDKLVDYGGKLGEMIVNDDEEVV